MSEVFCPLCGDNIDPNHSGCGRADCPYKDSDVPTEHIGPENKETEKETPINRDPWGFWEEYGNAIDAGEAPQGQKPVPPWKKR